MKVSALTRRRLSALVLGVVAVLLLTELAAQGLDRLRVSRVLLLAEARTGHAVRLGSEGNSMIVENIAALRAAALYDPAEVGVPVALAGQYLLLRRWDSAIAAYDSALALEPRPEIYLNRARALLGAGRPPEAVDDFERAIMLAPFLRDAIPPAYRTEVLARVRERQARDEPKALTRP